MELAQDARDLLHLVVAARVGCGVGAHPVGGRFFEGVVFHRVHDFLPQVLSDAGPLARGEKLQHQRFQPFRKDAAQHLEGRGLADLFTVEARVESQHAGEIALRALAVGAAEQDVRFRARHADRAEHGGFDERGTRRRDDLLDVGFHVRIGRVHVHVALPGLQKRHARARGVLRHRRRYGGKDIAGIA